MAIFSFRLIFFMLATLAGASLSSSSAYAFGASPPKFKLKEARFDCRYSSHMRGGTHGPGHMSLWGIDFSLKPNEKHFVDINGHEDDATVKISILKSEKKSPSDKKLSHNYYRVIFDRIFDKEIDPDNEQVQAGMPKNLLTFYESFDKPSNAIGEIITERFAATWDKPAHETRVIRERRGAGYLETELAIRYQTRSTDPDVDHYDSTFSCDITGIPE